MLTIIMEQEVSEILSGRISNADEEEVEDELAALEAEVNGCVGTAERLPNAPTTDLPAQKSGEESAVVSQPTKQRERQVVFAS